MPPRPAKFLKSCLLAVSKIAVSIGLLYLLARHMDTTAVWDALAGLPLDAPAFAWAVLIIQTLVLSLRWWLVIGAIGTPFAYGKVVPLMFIGIFFNQVLPSSFGGDAVRMWRIYRSGIPYQAAINGVLLERISGLVGLVVVVALGIGYMGARIDDLPLRYGLLAMLPLTLLGTAFLAALDRLPGHWRRWRPLREVARLAADSRRILLDPPAAIPLLVLSILSHVLAAVAIFALADGLELGVTLWDSLALAPAVVLVTIIPVSFAGWGLREGAMVMMFGFAGVAADAALAMSIVFGVVMLAASLPGCVLWLAWRETSPAG
ncbi:MAG: lysylphosphatidylglycerol synthase transmembrane domain-containing protein [Kiloniellaceae bacterium]